MFHPKGPSFLQLAQQALSSTIDGYDLLAEKFEYTPFRTPDLFVKVLVDEAMKGDHESILDIGVGTGAIPRGFLREGANSKIVGVDYSPGMLEEARKLTAEEFEDFDVEYKHQNALEIEYENEFDVITSSGAFGHFEMLEYERLVSKISTALKPGGRFLFLTYPKPTKANPAYWIARGFNTAMHVRNLIIDPPFIMFYLRFTVEQSAEILWRHGFEVRVQEPDLKMHRALRLVTATKV